MNIVVAVDGSYHSLHALSEALTLAGELSHRPSLYAVCVVAPDILAEEAETALAAARELCEERGYQLDAQTLRGHVVSEVLTFARDRQARMIVVGTHGRKGVQRAILGSTCEGLIRSSDIPVLAVRAS